ELLARVARVQALPLRALVLRQEIGLRRSGPVFFDLRQGDPRRRQQNQEDGDGAPSPSRAPSAPLNGSPGGRDHPFFGGTFGFAAGFAADFSGIVPSGFRTTKSYLRSIP